MKPSVHDLHFAESQFGTKHGKTGLDSKTLRKYNKNHPGKHIADLRVRTFEFLRYCVACVQLYCKVCRDMYGSKPTLDDVKRGQGAWCAGVIPSSRWNVNHIKKHLDTDNHKRAVSEFARAGRQTIVALTRTTEIAKSQVSDLSMMRDQILIRCLHFIVKTEISHNRFTDLGAFVGSLIEFLCDTLEMCVVNCDESVKALRAAAPTIIASSHALTDWSGHEKQRQIIHLIAQTCREINFAVLRKSPVISFQFD